jgi:phasin family protein
VAGEGTIMAARKIKNGLRRPEVTSSAVSRDCNRGKQPPQTIDRIETPNIREDDMNGSTGMTMGVTKTVANLTKAAGELTSFSQGNIGAIVQSGQVWAAGCQDISKAMAAAAQAHLDRTASAWKALISVKSLKEAMDLRTSLTHVSFETAFAETGKLTDASVKLAEQTMAPITERVMLAVERFSHRAN